MYDDIKRESCVGCQQCSSVLSKVVVVVVISSSCGITAVLFLLFYHSILFCFCFLVSFTFLV